MAGHGFPPIGVNVSKTLLYDESKNILGVAESSRALVPIVSNTILIKNCQAKVLGDTFTPCSDLSEDVFGDGTPHHDTIKTLHPETEPNDNLYRIESEMIDADYYYTCDSSSRSSKREESKYDDKVLSTFRLLEEVSYRILGNKHPSLPKVEKVEVLSSETELPIDREEMSEDEMTLDEEEEEGDEYTKDLEYSDYVKYAKNLVDGVLHRAADICKFKYNKKIVCVTFAEDLEKDDIIWPTIEQFSVRVGAIAIDRYIKQAFILAEAWKYKIKHLISQSDKVSDFYLYDAKFCIPTHSYPIAQATVSVFFTIEVSRVVPKHLPVRASFTLESLRTVMVPGETQVNDDMLLRVLYAKLMVFRSIQF